MKLELWRRPVMALLSPVQIIVAAVALLIMVLTFQYLPARADSGIVINGTPLNDEITLALTEAYGPISPGRYWYDPISGYVGLEGGPSTGKIEPFLQLGGPLRADASGSGTLVFINGRQIHPSELAYLVGLFGSVEPGRYWLGADGVGGVEGGPPAFNLNVAAGRSSGSSGGGSVISSGDGKSVLSTGSDGCTYFSSGGISASTC